MDVIDDRRLSTSTMRHHPVCRGTLIRALTARCGRDQRSSLLRKCHQTPGRRHQHVSGCGAREDPNAIGDRTLTAE